MMINDMIITTTSTRGSRLMFNKTIHKMSQAIRSNTAPIFHDVASKISESTPTRLKGKEEPVVRVFRELREKTIAEHNEKNGR